MLYVCLHIRLHVLMSVCLCLPVCLSVCDMCVYNSKVGCMFKLISPMGIAAVVFRTWGRSQSAVLPIKPLLQTQVQLENFLLAQ